MKRLLAFLFYLLTSGSAYAAYNPANIPAINNITQLRSTTASQYPSVYLTKYNVTTGIGGGEFNYTGVSSCTDDGGVLIQAVGGCYRRNTGGLPYNIAWFGAQCGGYQVVDGVSTSTSHTVTSITSAWTASMVGWVAVVNKAATSGNQLVTTVSGFTNAGSITLTAAAGASGTAETISLYPDDTTAFSNTVTAADRDSTSMTFPAGQTCGVANPGTASYWNLTFPNVYLNGATVWLGQTGPTSDTGWGFNMEGVNTSGSQWTGVSVVGPGTVDGLYQTNQGIAQNSISDAFVWNDGGGTVINNAAVTGHVIIQNTKGAAITAQGVNNFTIDNVLVQNCGDYSYQHSGTPGDMAGRPMCATIASGTGEIKVSNFTALNAAQSGILLESFATASGHAALTNCYFSGNGYYGFDAEVITGALDIANCTNFGNGVAPAGALISGGYIIRDAEYVRATNIQSYLVDSNAIVAESIDGGANQTNWSFSNVDVTGTVNHAGQIYIAFTADGVPQRIALENVNYDVLTVAPTGSPACSTTAPQYQLFKFNHIQASQNLGPTYSTIFNPQAAASQMLYILGSDSNLGAVSVASLGGTNNKWGYFDLFRVQMNSTPTFTGGVTAGTYSTISTSNPLSSFSCP